MNAEGPITPEDNARARDLVVRTAENLLREASAADPELVRPFTRYSMAKLFDISARAGQPVPDADAEWERLRGLMIEACDIRVQRTAARIAREKADRDKHIAFMAQLNATAERWNRLPPHVQDEMIAERRLVMGGPG